MVTVSLTPQGVGSHRSKGSISLSSRTLGQGTGSATRRDRMAREPSRPSVLERTPPYGEPLSKEYPIPMLPGASCEVSAHPLRHCRVGHVLSVTLFYKLRVRHVWDSCGHWVTCSGVCCVCHCISVRRHSQSQVRGWHGNRGRSATQKESVMDVGMGCHMCPQVPGGLRSQSVVAHPLG